MDFTLNEKMKLNSNSPLVFVGNGPRDKVFPAPETVTATSELDNAASKSNWLPSPT